jgi:ribosomal protein S18 acetylase RimI-like enzyme
VPVPKRWAFRIIEFQINLGRFAIEVLGDKMTDTIYMENKANDIPVGPAVPGDGAMIAAVHKHTWRETYPNAAAGIAESDVISMTKNFDDPERIKEWEQKISANGQNDNYVSVAKDAGLVVAFCCGKKDTVNNRLSAIYILPAYQGRGIGRRLADNVFGWMGREKKIIVTPVEYNLPAIGFYKKLGFVVVEGKRSVKEMPSGKVMPLIEMELVPGEGIAAPDR